VGRLIADATRARDQLATLGESRMSTVDVGAIAPQIRFTR
jgi:hypothetical protein